MYRFDRSIKNPAPDDLGTGHDHKLCQYIRGESDRSVVLLLKQQHEDFRRQTCLYDDLRRRHTTAFDLRSEYPYRRVQPR